MPPFFSVIMPALNRAHCIKDSLRSVLNQKFSDFEIIVFDAGSQDGTAEAASSLNDSRIKVGTYPASKGVNFSRNRAIEMATGEWLVFLDSDDQLIPEAFDTMIKDISTLEKEIALIFYGTRNIKTGSIMSFFDLEKGPVSYEDWLGEKRLKGEFLPIAHRRIFKEEMFREDLAAFEKYFWLKVAQKHKVWIHNVILRLYESEGKDRLTKQLMTYDFVAQRVYSYQFFLNTFGKDMKRVNSQLYAHYLSVLGHLYFLIGDKKRGRKVLNEVIKYNSGLKAYGMYACSFLGKWPFQLANRIARWWC